jgi:hypothetical protein
MNTSRRVLVGIVALLPVLVGCSVVDGDDSPEDEAVADTAASSESALTTCTSTSCSGAFVGCSFTAQVPKYTKIARWTSTGWVYKPAFEGAGTWSCPKRVDNLFYRQTWSLQSCGYGSCGDVAKSVMVQPTIIGGSGSWSSYAVEVGHQSYYRSRICVDIADDYGHIYQRGGCVAGPMVLL